MWLVSQEERRALVICPLLSSWKYQVLGPQDKPQLWAKTSPDILYIYSRQQLATETDYKTHILNKGDLWCIPNLNISPCLPQAWSIITNIPQLVHSVGTELLPFWSCPPVKDVMGIVLLHLTVSKWIANSFWTGVGAGFFLGKQKKKKKWGLFIRIFDQSGLDKLFS